MKRKSFFLNLKTLSLINKSCQFLVATQYHPVNVFDGEEDTGAELLANFNKYLAPNSAQHFAIYDFIKEMHCFHSENVSLFVIYV